MFTLSISSYCAVPLELISNKSSLCPCVTDDLLNLGCFGMFEDMRSKCTIWGCTIIRTMRPAAILVLGVNLEDLGSPATTEPGFLQFQIFEETIVDVLLVYYRNENKSTSNLQ